MQVMSPFSLAVFQKFSLCFFFQHFYYEGSFVDLFVVGLLEILRLPGCVAWWYSTNFGNFQQLFIWMFCLPFSLLSFWHSCYIMFVFLIELHIFCSTVYFLNYFSLFFELHNLYWSIFKFTVSSAISNLIWNSSREYFILFIVIYDSTMSIWFFL